jgi:xanthosine utilization system XapX-like protein
MRPYLASVILGVAVGVVYGLVKVRSPAPHLRSLCWASSACSLANKP